MICLSYLQILNQSNITIWGFMEYLISGLGPHITLCQTRGPTLLQMRTVIMGSTRCITYCTMQHLSENWNVLLEAHLRHQLGVGILQWWDTILHGTVHVMNQRPLMAPAMLTLTPNGPLGDVCCLYQQLWALHVREHFHQGTHERSIEL